MSYGLVVWDGPRPEDEREASATCRAIQQAAAAQSDRGVVHERATDRIDAFLTDAYEQLPALDQLMDYDLSAWPDSGPVATAVTLSIV